MAIIGVLLLLNWWMVSCGRLACDIRPAWAAAEASTPASCPPNIKAAATDAVWARGVYDNLPDWQYKGPANGGKKTKTSGWFFADGTSTEKLISGEGSKADPDPLWQEAARLLAAAPGINHPAAGAHPSASHAESKAAVWMRQNKITYAVAVINNREGPCGEQDADARFACAAAIPAILPVGSTMVVWWWSNREGRMVDTVRRDGAGMSAPTTGRVGTLLDRPNKRVYQADEFGELADVALVDEHYELGSQRVVWADDLTRPRPRGWSPETVVVIIVNGGCGAAYFRSANHAWITHNPHPAAGTPELIFDDQVDANFPPDAAVPVGQLHKAIEEYLLTGQQPSCVRWRPAERYLTW